MKIPLRHVLVAIALMIVVLSVLQTRSSSQVTLSSASRFEKIEAMIPMRDGVKLNTEIYIPKNVSTPLPILFTRTPYGLGHDADGYSPALKTSYKELADDGYIFAFQDIRGRFKSEGQFVMQRPPRDRSDTKSIDEGTDAYDTIDWMIKNVRNNNGRVGVLGISYGGWLTVMALLEPHPAMKAASEQASPADMFLGDDFHHNGAFRLSYGFEYAAQLETSKENTQFNFDNYDTYEWYLNLGALANANEKYFHEKLPTWNDFVNHPNYDSFWQRYAVTPYLKQITVPNLNVAGWWDQEDFYGPIKIYETLEKNDSNHLNYLVVGPWNHGGWARSDGNKLGKIDFQSATSIHFREKIQTAWFAYYLKDKGSPYQPEALVFETGTNKWVSYDSWPPRQNVTEKNLYFRERNRLSFDAPTKSTEEFDSYVSDPAHPVPYRQRPIEPTYYPKGSGWPIWLVEDQRFVEGRPDVLTLQTETLDKDVTISGDIIAHLFASTSGSDSDFIAKLIDVYPEDYPPDPKMGGYRLMIANDVLRGRFRKSFEKPSPIVPDQVNEYTIDLHTNAHTFLKGHKIMVQVQSTWFPVIDRNPQTYVENIFKAKDPDYRTATLRIYRSKTHPSHIVLSVAGSSQSN